MIRLPASVLEGLAKDSQFLFGPPRQQDYEFAAATNPGFFFGSPSIPSARPPEPHAAPSIPAAALRSDETQLKLRTEPPQSSGAVREMVLMREQSAGSSVQIVIDEDNWETMDDEISRRHVLTPSDIKSPDAASLQDDHEEQHLTTQYSAVTVADTKAACSDSELEYDYDEQCLSKQSPYIQIPAKGTTPQDNTTVHIAVLYGHEGVARASARSDPSVLAKENANKDTPLHLAAATGHASLVETFIKTATKFQHPQHRRYEVRSREIMQEAAEDQNDEILATRELLMKVDRNGGTPLHEAMRHGHESTALLLVEAQPDASEVVDGLGYSVLYLAVLKGSLRMVRRLLEIESSSHAGPQGSTAMHAAVLVDNLEIGEELLSKRPDLCRNEHSSPLQNATFTNKLEMVKLMMKHDRSIVYDKDRHGNTAVHAAAMKGHLDILREFLWQCPDSGFCLNNSHQNILVMAVLHQQSEVIKYVLGTPNLSSLINQPDISGNTPLHWAAFKCDPHLLRLLLADKRVDKLATNMHGQSAVDIFYTKVEMNATIDWVRMKLQIYNHIAVEYITQKIVGSTISFLG